MELQKRLVELRKERGLSQENLAEKLYVSRQTISNWETGKTYPDINSLLLIATYFDISLDYLVKGDLPTMKQALEQKLLKKWLLILVLAYFAFSVAYPTRYLLDSNQFSLLITFLGSILLFSLFQVCYIIKRYSLNTYADLVNFLNGKQRKIPKWQSELGLVLALLLTSWLIFFLGTVLSTFLFWSS